MPLPFNKNLDKKLINLVRENPILYNTKQAKYLDFDSREVVWQKIGDSLNRPALVCKSRWINIRDMMRRKIRDRVRNPSQRSYNYKYEDELSFMIPFFKDINTSQEDFSEYLDEDTPEVEMPSEVFVDESNFESHEREMKPAISNLRTIKRTDDFIETVQELSPTDPLDVFLMTIGATLRKFSPYYLNQAKSNIFQVVQDYELKQIVAKDNEHALGSSDGNR